MAGLGGILSGAGSGAASGVSLGPWGAIGGAALGALPSVIGLFTGNAQRKKANRINPVDPGFVANPGVLNNQRIVNEMYNNYTLPGKSGIQDQLDSSYATGLATATQGASSSDDVLDSAIRLNQQQNNSINALGIQEAQQKQGLLPMVLDANTAAGNEAVRRNAYDEERYQAQLREKAALTQAGAANQFNSVDNLATLGGSLLNYKAQPSSSGVSTGSFKSLPPINYRGVNGKIIS